MTALSLVLDTPELAQHYEQASADRQFKAGQVLVSALGIQRGERVLDVGSGTGLLAEHVATLVGPTGSVLGIDPLPLRVEIANKKQRDNLAFKVGQAERLEGLADASFDVVYVNAVFHWLPEKLTPLREALRVLKPGGRLGISTGERGSSTLRVLRRKVLSSAPFDQHADPDDDVAHNVTADELRQLLEQAGYRVSKLEVQPHATHHASADAAISFAQASSFGNYLGRLPELVQARARAALEAELEKSRTPEGIPLRGARLIAVAVKS